MYTEVNLTLDDSYLDLPSSIGQKNFLVKLVDVGFPKEALLREYEVHTNLTLSRPATEPFIMKPYLVLYPYLLLEYVDGEDLSFYLHNSFLFYNFHAAMYVLREVARSIRYCHARYIIHSDIKPKNVLISSETGDVILIDYGSARNITLSTEPIYYRITFPYVDRRYNTHGEWPKQRLDYYSYAAMCLHLFQCHPVQITWEKRSRKIHIDSYGLKCFESNQDAPGLQKIDKIRQEFRKANSGTSEFISIKSLLEKCFTYDEDLSNITNVKLWDDIIDALSECPFTKVDLLKLI